MRLIDADVLKEELIKALHEDLMDIDEAIDVVVTTIDDAPTVDPVKHGQWKRTDAYPHKVYCSECYATLVPNDEWLELYKLSSNYCPNCGAHMGVEE